MMRKGALKKKVDELEKGVEEKISSVQEKVSSVQENVSSFQESVNTKFDRMEQLLRSIIAGPSVPSTSHPSVLAIMGPPPNSIKSFKKSSTKSSNRSGDSGSEDGLAKKRHKPAEKEDEAMSTSSIAPSNCLTTIKEAVIGKSFYDITKENQVPEEEFHRMLRLENLPLELAELAYEDLARHIDSHADASLLNEATRKSIIHSLIVTICTYVTKMFEMEKKYQPEIALESSLVWCFEHREVKGRLDIGVFRRDSKKKKKKPSNMPSDERKLYYYFIEMKATTISEGMQQGLMYLKRVREMNIEDEIVYGFSCTLLNWQMLSLKAGTEFQISSVYPLVDTAGKWDDAYKHTWIKKHSLFVQVIYTLMVHQMEKLFKRKK